MYKNTKFKISTVHKQVPPHTKTPSRAKMMAATNSPATSALRLNLTLVRIEVEDGRRWTVEPEFGDSRS